MAGRIFLKSLKRTQPHCERAHSANSTVGSVDSIRALERYAVISRWALVFREHPSHYISVPSLQIAGKVKQLLQPQAT
jgi:hypothetical protein